MTATQKPYRTLTNPPARLEIPQDFPELGYYGEWPQNLRPILEKGAKLFGTTLDQISRISIAYPHRSPTLYPDYKNKALHGAEILQSRLQTERFQMVMAHAIHDTRILARSEDQSALHTLGDVQEYAADPALQKEDMPFLHEGGDGEFFVLVDLGYEQGTTLASLHSFITHNGGRVLAAFVDFDPFNEIPYIQQKNPFGSLSAEFSRVTDLGPRAYRLLEKFEEFGCNDAESRLRWFDRQLHAAGHSLQTLTQGEIDRLRSEIFTSNKSVDDFVAALNAKRAARQLLPA